MERQGDTHMINSVTVTNNAGRSLVLELRFPEKSGFLVRSIEGLTPSEASINTTDIAGDDGSIYNSARLSFRNIVLYLKFLPHPTIEDTRLLSYEYFPVKKKIHLTIETDKRLCEIDGYVESNQPTIFSECEETQISIICPDPYFYSVTQKVTYINGIIPNFVFEFSNESLTENCLEFSTLETVHSKNIVYEGDSDVGCIFGLTITGVVSGITLYNTTTNESMKINTERIGTITGTAIGTGDVIILSTVKDDKYLVLLRNGEYTNIINSLDRNSSWIHLTRGNNVIAYVADTGDSNIELSIRNRIVYEGV